MSTTTAMRTTTTLPTSMAFGLSPVSDFATVHKRIGSECSSAKGKAVHSWRFHDKRSLRASTAMFPVTTDGTIALFFLLL
nr:MAG TPA: hypothetical protein [Caudoviricetes sp.]